MDKFIGKLEVWKENYVQKNKTAEQEKKFYEEMVDKLQQKYGIKFNIIESVGLNVIVKKVWEEYWQLLGNVSQMMIREETEDRFLREFFDMTLRDLRMFKNSKEREEYFKAKQEEKNLI